MKLYFVRHGESKANILHVISNRGFTHGLTRRGFQQAEQLSINLQNIPFAKIFSSPLKRALQTAEILQSRQNCPLEVTDALREFDCGVLEGNSDPESWETHTRVFRQWLAGDRAARIPGGESHFDIQERFIPLVEGLTRNNTNEVFLLVGHGGLFASMLPLVLTNIAPDSDLIYQIDHTMPIIAEKRPDGMFCTRWGPNRSTAETPTA